MMKWESRADNDRWKNKRWLSRTQFLPEAKSICETGGTRQDTSGGLPIHIKLGLMKQFENALDKQGRDIVLYT